MTLGERIQKCRKELSLSQEELGQKLLVSRQTISLWEKDQTVPTIDNLMRLSDIFDTSVDEILGSEDKNQNAEIQPSEAYQFRFSKEELNEIYRFQRRSLYKNTITFALICIILLLGLLGNSAHEFMTGFVFGMLFIGLVSHIKGIFVHSKRWKNNVELVAESTYEYKVFEDFIEVNIYRENEKTGVSKCDYSNIEQIMQCGKWLLLQFGGQSFVIRKSELKDNSVFYSYMYRNPMKTIDKPVPNGWRVAADALFAASLLSIFAALGLVKIVSDVNNLFIENMWLFFLLTPIPLASTVLGFVLKSKGYKYKKNVIAGIIMSVSLCIYGSFSFVFANVYDHSDESIVRAEQTIGIDIPEHKQINTQDWTTGTQMPSRGYIYSISTISFDDSAVVEFEKQLDTDDRWLSSVPNGLIGISSPFGSGAFDYELIYNTNTSELNTLPSKNGKFSFMSLLYSLEDNQMMIVEYEIDYVE